MTYYPERSSHSVRPLAQIESDVRKFQETQAKDKIGLTKLRDELDQYPTSREAAGELRDQVQELLNRAKE